MQILKNFPDCPLLDKTSITIGNFDGLHRGHVEIINNLKDKAKQLNTKSLVIFFEPQPLEVLRNDPPNRITSKLNKIELLAQHAIDYVLILPFDKNFSQLQAQDFIYKLVSLLNMKHISIGDDFKFGANREGDFNFLTALAQKYDFTVSRNQSFLEKGIRISSSYIRELLAESKFSEAKEMLGYEYQIKGTIESGKGIAKKELALPTANIRLQQKPAIHGVYLVKIKIADCSRIYYGVSNIGTNPSTDLDNKWKCETYVFALNEVLNHKVLSIIPLAKIRNEEKFSSLEDLKRKIHQDLLKSIDLLDNIFSNIKEESAEFKNALTLVQYLIAKSDLLILETQEQFNLALEQIQKEKPMTPEQIADPYYLFYIYRQLNKSNKVVDKAKIY